MKNGWKWRKRRKKCYNIYLRKSRNPDRTVRRLYGDSKKIETLDGLGPTVIAWATQHTCIPSEHAAVYFRWLPYLLVCPFLLFLLFILFLLFLLFLSFLFLLLFLSILSFLCYFVLLNVLREDIRISQ